MMTLSDVQAELAVLNFWPNYTFEATAHPFRGLVVHVTYTVPDSNNMARTIDIGNHHNVPKVALRNDSMFLDWLVDELVQKAVHETLEAFRPRGESWIDPHDEHYPWLVG